MALDPTFILQRARQVLLIEQEAITATREALGPDFVAVAQAVHQTILADRKIIFTGVGKSAHIAQKLAGTFNSTGAPSTFLDPTQALHGDLGMVHAGDIALLLSNSGQTDEILKLVPLLRRFGLGLVAFTARPESDLATGCDYRLPYTVPREACPLALAPTASTTAALALGDALAMVLLEARGLTRDDFARFHPAGNLGRVLLLKVSDIMRAGERLPLAADNITLQEAILCMTKARSGSIALVDADSGQLTGILTDGDFRRSALSGPDFLQQRVANFMTRQPKTIAATALGVDALRLFEAHKFDDLIVIDSAGKPIGLIDGQDLPKLKIF
jgi:arabinose-5-phosphate isomerase